MAGREPAPAEMNASGVFLPANPNKRAGRRRWQMRRRRRRRRRHARGYSAARISVAVATGDGGGRCRRCDEPPVRVRRALCSQCPRRRRPQQWAKPSATSAEGFNRSDKGSLRQPILMVEKSCVLSSQQVCYAQPTAESRRAAKITKGANLDVLARLL
ncbi:uncharacterized protein LOC126252256 [Schistocerca nitens]|uniref:uncharacterized protein LOC126252256 n=1 Tax=Schistocerca nitens TaxID=7011 RepID=UPI002118BC52|nr:uncharacterized protein LOC126252256 [Schistocerca nitens]